MRIHGALLLASSALGCVTETLPAVRELPTTASVEPVASPASEVFGEIGEQQIESLIELENVYAFPNSHARIGSSKEIFAAIRNECRTLFRFTLQLAHQVSPTSRLRLLALVDAPAGEPIPLVAAARVLGAAGDTEGLDAIVRRRHGEWRASGYANIRATLERAISEGRTVAHDGVEAMCPRPM